MTYAEVARKAGNSKAARAVGAVMRANKNYKEIPCHRVICSDGSLGNYNRPGGTATKRKILQKEGALK